MTREELKAHCKKEIEMCEFWAHGRGEELDNNKVYQEHKLILELLEQEPCEDAISRQAVLDLPRIKIHNKWGNVIKENVNVEDVRRLPPVTSQPKTGHWIPRNSFLLKYKCSECNCESEKYNFCPNCGAKMIEP